MPTVTASTSRVVELDGSELAPDIDAQLESAVVVDRLTMPDTFTLVFRDPDRDILARAAINVGTKVRISTTSLRADAPAELIVGEVTGIEADYDGLGSRAVVRGYDLSHRLTAGRRSQTFENVKYSDIARTIASDAGLRADIDESTGTVEHVFQRNESDLTFLYGISKRIGYDVRVVGQTLMFKRRVESSTGPPAGDFASEAPDTLVWNHNLHEFRARVSAVAQVREVVVRGWDTETKKAIIGKAAVATSHAELNASPKPAELAGTIGGKTLVMVDRPVDSQQAADALAAAKAEQVGSTAYEATAVAIGSPDLKTGVAFSIAGVDPALEGKWVISSSRHELGTGTYRTHLEFSGRQDRSLHGLVASGLPGSTGGEPSRFFGVAVGVVTGNEDPLARGRVRVTYPWLGDDVDSWWARVAMPGAGNGAGMVWIPQVGDEVIVAFEHGDISYPVVLGGLWNGKDKAPLGAGLFDAGTVTRSGFVSRKGHQLIFFDGDQGSGIALISEKGTYKVSLNETKDQLHVQADGKLLIEAGSIEIKVRQGMSVDAAEVGIKASGQVKLKGATIALNPPGG
jgi:uncharacterized protein involved in type VI secretion and phage assembly